ncbi:phytanoyl-CoA dioxygenase family protein [Nocardia transvalensis]|nr:phytanoyl-CoA dioxygenase family protein [Nocardia transvalensis]
MPRVTIPLRAGGCTFHHVRTIPMAGANETDTPRVSSSACYVNRDGS